MLTLAWMGPALVFFFLPLLTEPYKHSTFQAIRVCMLVAIVAIAVFGIVRAWHYIGGAKTAAPWFTDPFLVALVIFWAVAPPTWFFLEYYMFDLGNIKLPEGKTPGDKPDFLKDIKTYADLGSKVWAAVGASLGAAIAAARK